MLDGTLTGASGNGGSFARVSGMMMVTATILLVFFLTAMLFLNICNPLLNGGEPIVFNDELLKECKRRFEPGGLAAFLTAGGGVLTAATVFIYRENKKAETRNGG